MYKHTQVGWIMVLAAAVVIFVIPVFLPHHPGAIAGVYAIRFIGLVILFLFLTLTVTVGDGFVGFYFGLGLIRRRFVLEDIVTCRALRTSWLNGWGIHGCPGKGWLYNVSGFDAIELVMKNGMKYYIGTDDPSGLCEAIRKQALMVTIR